MNDRATEMPWETRGKRVLLIERQLRLVGKERSSKGGCHRAEVIISVERTSCHCGGYDDNIFGHLIFSPSNHRMYSSSAMGDRLTGEASPELSPPGVVGVAMDPDGPEISSTTSVTTRPRFVISLFRVTRLWGKRPLDVCTCCRIAALLGKGHDHKLDQ
jgi:hypothetical protein